MAGNARTAAELRAAAAKAAPDAFISYAREDQLLADQLSAGLAEAGKTVWIDREAIPYASIWRARARAGVEASKAVVFVLSEDWVASEACAFELRHAVDTQKRLVPVSADPELDAKLLPSPVRDLAWISAGHAVDATTIAALVETLDRDLAWRDEHARLLVRAIEWQDGDGDRSLLLRGADLNEAEGWLANPTKHGETATPEHTGFIIASRREATRRQRVVLGLVALAMLVSVTLGALAFWQRGVARDNERQAIAQRRVAVRNAHVSRSRELAAKATTQLDDDPELALLLGVEAAKAAPTVQAEEVLRAALPRTNHAVVLRHPGTQAIATSADGTMAVTGNADGTGRSWDLRAGRRLGVLRGHSPLQVTDVSRGVLAVAVSHDGAMAATAGAEGDVRIWDPRRGRLLHLIKHPAGGVSDIGVSVALVGPAARQRVVTAGVRGEIRTWDPATGRSLDVARLPGFEVTSLAVSADGRRIAAAAIPNAGSDQARGLVAVFDGPSLAPISRLHTTALDLWFSQDGTRLITKDLRAYRLWDVRSGSMLRAFRSAAWRLSRPTARRSPSRQPLTRSSSEMWRRARDVRRCATLARGPASRSAATAGSWSRRGRTGRRGCGTWDRGDWSTPFAATARRSFTSSSSDPATAS